MSQRFDFQCLFPSPLSVVIAFPAPALRLTTLPSLALYLAMNKEYECTRFSDEDENGYYWKYAQEPTKCDICNNFRRNRVHINPAEQNHEQDIIACDDCILKLLFGDLEPNPCRRTLACNLGCFYRCKRCKSNRSGVNVLIVHDYDEDKRVYIGGIVCVECGIKILDTHRHSGNTPA